jgi:hypothetical protein
MSDTPRPTGRDLTQQVRALSGPFKYIPMADGREHDEHGLLGYAVVSHCRADRSGGQPALFDS